MANSLIEHFSLCLSHHIDVVTVARSVWKDISGQTTSQITFEI